MMQLSQVAQLTAGVLHGADLTFERVSTDTRSLQPGDFFVALRGEHFEGADFLPEAAKKGACAAMTEAATGDFASYVQVTDCRKGLGLMAAGWAAQFPLKKIAVTGNAGKTTVKEMIAVMLGESTLATSGNLNNDIGVPLTLLNARPEHRFAVIELGANAQGEIAWTSSLVVPDVALITNVTGAHLEGFGSMQGIAEAKSEIFDAMSPGAVAIVNQDDGFAGYFRSRAAEQQLKIVSVGQMPGCDFSATAIAPMTDKTGFILQHENKEYSVIVPLPGKHQVSNALMALAAVDALGISLRLAIERLATLAMIKSRLNVSSCLGGTLIDDSYNANPGSVKAAIDLLVGMPKPRVLVLGTVAELGEYSEQQHQIMGGYAAESGIERLITVGDETAPAANAFGKSATQVADHQQAADLALSVLRKGGSVLVKGSRSAAMDKVVRQLQAMEEHN